MNSAEQQVSSVQEEVKEIAKLLSRATKNYQMYLSNNRMFLTSLENLLKTLTDYLEINEVLTFVVREFELFHEETSVYSNDDKYQSIAFRMYRDGVRLLSFHKGITENDLIAFFEALTRCMDTDNLEEDFITLLWEKDLQAITYYEVNDLEAGYADYDALRKENDAKRGPGRSITQAEIDAAPWNRAPGKSDRLKPSIILTPEDLHEVQDLTLTVDDDLFLRRACQVFRQTLDMDPSKETYLELENALKGFLDACVSRKQIALASEILGDMAERYRGFADQEVLQALHRIVQDRHGEKAMASIAEVLAGGSETEHDHCRAYLARLSPQAIPNLIRLLPHCTRPSARDVLAASIAEVGRACPPDIVKGIDVTSADEVALALDVMESIGTEEALAGALHFARHASPKVRAKVAQLTARLGNRTALETAKRLILDQDHGVRRRALSSLVEIAGDGSVETLLTLYTSREFHNLSHDSKLSLLLAIRSLSPRGQHEVIRGILKARRLFKAKPLEDTKVSLIEIMHLMNTEIAVAELNRVCGGSSGKIRKAGQAALEKMSHEDAPD